MVLEFEKAITERDPGGPSFLSRRASRTRRDAHWSTSTVPEPGPDPTPTESTERQRQMRAAFYRRQGLTD